MEGKQVRAFLSLLGPMIAILGGEALSVASWAHPGGGGGGQTSPGFCVEQVLPISGLQILQPQ